MSRTALALLAATALATGSATAATAATSPATTIATTSGVAAADQAAPGSLLARPTAKGSANADFASAPGPYEVQSDTVYGDCRGLAGLIVRIGVRDPNLQCGTAFPYGFDSPVSQAVYYPDASAGDDLPVVNFVGGIGSNDGHYEAMARHWASQGFVVVVSNDFINSTPAMHLLGFQELTRLADDPESPIQGRVDLSRTIVAGHSAGGGAALQVSAFDEETQHEIDPRLTIIGSLPIEPGPLALGSQVKAPTLLLTGGRDLVVPAITWPLVQYNNIKTVPAWRATADTADHFSPMQSSLTTNEFGGITTAFIRYLAQGDEAASAYFVGPDYRLSQDAQFAQRSGSILSVTRNELAASAS